MRRLDKKKTEEARDKHEAGVARLNKFFGFKPEAVRAAVKHCRPVKLRRAHKRARQARRRARLGR